MKHASGVLLLALYSALVPASQVNHQEKKPNTSKSQKSETPKPPPAIPSDSETNQIKAKPEENKCSDNQKERAYRVEIISQPFDWTSLAAIVIALLSMGFVWQQVRVMRNSERAWMTGDPEFNVFTKPPDPGDSVLYPASFKNCGRTPAQINEAGLSLKKAIGSLKNIPKNPSYEQREIVSMNRLLVPNDLFVLTAPPIALSVEEYQSLKDGALFLYAHGFVKYRDIFGKNRETRFCHYYRVPEAGGALVEGFSTFIDAPQKYNKAT